MLLAKKAEADDKVRVSGRRAQGLVWVLAAFLFINFCPAANAGMVKVSKSEAGAYTQQRAWDSCTKVVKSFQSCRLYNGAWVASRCRQKSVYPEVGPLKFVNIWYTVCPLRFGVRNKRNGVTHWWGCSFRVQKKRAAGRLEGGCQDSFRVIHH